MEQGSTNPNNSSQSTTHAVSHPGPNYHPYEGQQQTAAGQPQMQTGQMQWQQHPQFQQPPRGPGQYTGAQPPYPSYPSQATMMQHPPQYQYPPAPGAHATAPPQGAYVVAGNQYMGQGMDSRFQQFQMQQPPHHTQQIPVAPPVQTAAQVTVPTSQGRSQEDSERPQYVDKYIKRLKPAAALIPTLAIVTGVFAALLGEGGFLAIAIVFSLFFAWCVPSCRVFKSRSSARYVPQPHKCGSVARAPTSICGGKWQLTSSILQY
eukprot:gb/GECG01004373.1/.p1 GENE.gb/GECG01004373.1/~~gb/GECG01004373.1/.p1  ORF type:complete len:262 (+),score=14.36 gb/GECG01004373.1/:1-786(+)